MKIVVGEFSARCRSCRALLEVFVDPLKDNLLLGCCSIGYFYPRTALTNVEIRLRKIAWVASCNVSIAFGLNSNSSEKLANLRRSASMHMLGRSLPYKLAI